MVLLEGIVRLTDIDPNITVEIGRQNGGAQVAVDVWMADQHAHLVMDKRTFINTIWALLCDNQALDGDIEEDE